MKRTTWGDRLVNTIFYIILLVIIVVCAYPIWYTIVASVSDATYVNSGAFILLPKGVHFEAYQYAFAQKDLWNGYVNTILYTVAGTIFGLALCLPCGYALSRKDLPFRGIIMGLFVFTMYFSGGMIPTYLVINKLNLVNTRLILIILGSVSVYNMILIRTFFSSSIPDEMREAAFIDGCSNTRFFVQFALPLSKAIIAVIALYIAVAHWNNYYNALVYTTDRHIQPLQLYLRRLLLVSIDNESTDNPEEQMKFIQLVQVVRYAVIVMSTLPIMCLYPFLQKYFVQGVMIGSLKG
ncbi:MAG: carbohydrate ABC transporter permease [Clostridia bacterium]|nr:carbohydrate ABC transporter permease [Clostridiales bacterium]MBQ2977288.1 carbohydrate ABC transporter permease [Clostridia bacterium]MBQ6805166.1 carbohydrate ABC transporter permease [Clostridia bacterium]MDD6682299.1 carbohydrate ABC transporter permease [Clostridiales bacterium]